MPEREQYNNPDNDQGVGRTSFRLIDRFRSAGLRAALPLSAILLTVTAACAKGESDKPNEVMGSEKFTDDLPMTLREVCKLYVSSANLGPDEGEVERRLGNTMIGSFLDSNSQDPDARALYLSGLGFMLSIETGEDFDLVESSFTLAIDRGLPEVQEELATSVIESLSRLEEGADIEKEAADIVDKTFAIVDDLDANVCPE
ncbi:hypothetical protein A3D07_00935 [Candidatus Curtissbacteria bacterium RIFCSPHIGHO2_02_FULL_42_15]|uniref:Uncharacterized protein n=1 Tax=Candidatus Curtissbacteria bacterium RIFCSPHIGHO2_02_FULL_42_15 TaxID=1797716 RepID=A0A1F5GCM2_9BACT|nr:MAG: hypothetical protein A3D07_00935 [Candidatus Curtissbacteria bacterium RIFCSPHIGHO2_02_FULL_42_15]